MVRSQEKTNKFTINSNVYIYNNKNNNNDDDKKFKKKWWNSCLIVVFISVMHGSIEASSAEKLKLKVDKKHDGQK